MRFDDLVALFASQTVYLPALRAPGSPKRKPKIELEKKIYSLDSLPILINLLRQIQDDDFISDHKYSIRYLVDPSGEIWFAREGKAGTQIMTHCEIIPAHKEIFPECIAAGNLFFNEDFTEITAINNSSGDFLPAPNCLIWPIKQLKNSTLGFSDSFTLNILQNQQLSLHQMNLALSPEQIKQIQELPIDIPQAQHHTTPCSPLSAYEDSSDSDDEKSADAANFLSHSFFSEPAAAAPLSCKKPKFNNLFSSCEASNAMDTSSPKMALKF
jgi:hypothetical protein